MTSLHLGRTVSHLTRPETVTCLSTLWAFDFKVFLPDRYTFLGVGRAADSDAVQHCASGSKTVPGRASLCQSSSVLTLVPVVVLRLRVCTLIAWLLLMWKACLQL